MPEPKISGRYVCEIEAQSHIFSESAFSILKSRESSIRLLEINNNIIKIELADLQRIGRSQDNYILASFTIASNFLIALNIAAIGLFTWTSGSRLFWPFEHYSENIKKGIILLISKGIPYPAERRPLSEEDVRTAIMIFGALCGEGDQTFRREYLKGIIHINAGFGDLSFHREAFGNFYRALEYFVTARVLKRDKLSNELREIKEGLGKMGMRQEHVDEFASLYKIRSEQIMHAQKTPKEIDFEDVIKIKVFSDYALHKYFKAKAVSDLEEIRKTGSEITVKRDHPQPIRNRKQKRT
jgi:hypothetical protein